MAALLAQKAARIWPCGSLYSRAFARPALQLFGDERSLGGDQRLDFDGVTVVVDRMSGPYQMEATIDFVDRSGVHHRQPQRHRLLRLRRSFH